MKICGVELTIDEAKRGLKWVRSIAKTYPTATFSTSLITAIVAVFWYSKPINNKVKDAKEVLKSYSEESKTTDFDEATSNFYKFQFLTSNGEVSNRGELHCNGKSYPPDSLGVFKIPTTELGVSANGRYIRDEETCYDEKLPLDSTQIKELQTECL